MRAQVCQVAERVEMCMGAEGERMAEAELRETGGRLRQPIRLVARLQPP